jgi:hypothetical protein
VVAMSSSLRELAATAKNLRQGHAESEGKSKARAARFRNQHAFIVAFFTWLL